MSQERPFTQQSDPSPQAVTVSLGQRSYQIVIGHSLLNHAGRLIRETLGPEARQIGVVSNHTVFTLYGPAIARSLRSNGFECVAHLMGDGERYKTLPTVERICRSLARHRLDRRSAILALGGGVVGDVAGFAAASFLRGVAYIQMPTTLLAIIDSSVGGKTGVNLPEGKNLIGAFYQPRLVMADLSLLRTLPERERRAGLYEALKYGVIADAPLFDLVSQMASAPPPLNDQRWIQLASRCCQIKADVVAADEREAGYRQILNFGHTFGHAVEALTDYRRFKHGEAVGLGMILATRLAVELGMIDRQEAQKIEAGIQSVGPLPPIDDLDIDPWIDMMHSDKKALAGQLTFILPTRIGAVESVKNVPIEAAKRTLQQFISGQPRPPAVT